MSSPPPFPPKAIKAADRLAPLLVDGRPPRLLLVEDNATNALLGKALLEHLGCTVEVVAEDAAAVSRARSGRYDLILMDLSMPQVHPADGRGGTHLVCLISISISTAAEQKDVGRYSER